MQTQEVVTEESRSPSESHKTKTYETGKRVVGFGCFVVVVVVDIVDIVDVVLADIDTNRSVDV
jgi:hypothetical protein